MSERRTPGLEGVVVEEIAEQSAARAEAEAAARHAEGVADQFAGEVRDAALRMLTEQKSRAADAAHGVAEALQRAADGLRPEYPPIAHLADHVAGRVDSASTSLRERNWDDLVEDIRRLADRRPALFMLGAVAMGVALGRIMAAPPNRREAR